MERVLMKCGHTSQSEVDGNPVCVICFGITPKAIEIEENLPNLEGREAKCSFCGKTVKSSLDLAFFEHRPDDETDGYYCGCIGWD